MTFRDDREAAHQRAEALEKELQRMRREVATLRDERRPPRLRSALVVAALAVAAAAVGAGFWVLSSHQATEQRDAQIARERARREAEREEAAARELSARQAEARLAAMRVAAEDTARAERAAAEAARPVGRVVWSATVDEAAGVALRPGDACTLDGTFASARPSADLRSLTVQCGAEVIYRSTDDAGGAVATQSALREGPVFGSPAHVYMLSYRDELPRTGARPKATVSTLGHRATVWREGASPMRVTLFVRDVSAAREGPSLAMPRVARAPSFAEAVERTARVVAVHGSVPVRAGERCAFSARPVWEFGENCRLALRCGTTWLYGDGEAGYLTCELRDGRPVGALDERTTSEGGDPRVTWHGARITVSDFSEAGEWRVDLAM